MGWTPVLWAELELPPSSREAWLLTPLAGLDDAYEGFFQHDAGDLGATTVADALALAARAADAWTLSHEGDALRIRGVLSGDALLDAGGAIARALRAVALHGGSGRVLLADAGTRRGCTMTLAGGKAKFTKVKPDVISPEQLAQALAQADESPRPRKKRR